VGLILYMNFSDGTRYDQFAHEIIRLEVRDRDYFFTPGFVFFALLMGLGASGIVRRLSDFKDWLGYGAAVLVLILPITQLNKNYHTPNNRAGDHIPYVYAYNFLISCDPDAVLFTAGDNDTFPLWFIQEVEGVRKDVRIVNLSLLNTDWYILQLKDKMGVPVGLTYAQIKWVRTKLPNGREIERPVEPYLDPILKTKRYLTPYVDQNTRSLVRIQDMMIEQIIFANRWKYPIYFSSTVPSPDRLGLDNHLKTEGLALKLVPEEGENMIDPEKTHKLLWEVYRYDGINDLNVEQDDETANVLAYLPESFIDLSSYYLNNGKKGKSIAELEKAIELVPHYFRSYYLLSQIYRDSGEPEKEKEVISRGTEYLERLVKKRPEIVLHTVSLAFFYQILGEMGKAEKLLNQAFDENPNDSRIEQSLVNIYVITQRLDKAREVLEKWLQNHPDDLNAQNTLNRLNQTR